MEQKDKNLTAILGPTNTGKTYLAFDRLISYNSGIFGFPLRLLARENYDKAVLKIGFEKIALITGEEKILPKNAKYFFCTVESMPLDIKVDCVAIDEVQLAADYERGHIFTDRIINMRGTYETIFLGSLTIKKILLNLFPKISIQTRNRFSKLSFSHIKSLSKLNPRSAIIAFNINSVYEIAETLRTHKGGAAVVLGSLSPRTRNSQVEIYEDKKVDYIVATDAIGMGLNLNINHVAFSSLQKFDGKYNRNLSIAELGQIAGRAGRHLNEGTFGYLKSAGSLDPTIIKAIENHNFTEIKKIYWRNADIDFNSVETVLNSFKKFPVKDFFIHKKNAEDEINFRILSKDSEIIKYLNNLKSISLLWDVCRIPDFQKIFNDSYISLLKNIFLSLIKNNGKLNEQWLQEKILKLENYGGGIEELSIKISNIRTWTYIANQSNWIEDYNFWQQKTKEIEDNLSDHLHISLTKRFIDFSATYFVNSKKDGEEVEFKVDKNKKIKLNGQNYGYINGFDLKLNISNSKSLFSLIHVKKSIRSMIEEKINNFLKAPSDSLNFGSIESFNINEPVKIYWGDESVGQLKKGINIFTPKAEALNSEFVETDKKILITKKLQDWLDEKITSSLGSVTKEIESNIGPEVRTILFNVYNSLGTMLIGDYVETVKKLSNNDKIILSKNGIRIGAKFFFMPNLLKKPQMELNALLWSTYYHIGEKNKYPLPKNGRVSFESKIKMPESYWSAIGYYNFKDIIVRIDVFERIFFIARKKIKYGPFISSSDMMNPVGCNANQLTSILNFCNFASIDFNDNKKLFFHKPKQRQKKLIKKANTELKTIKIQHSKKFKKTLDKNNKLKSKKESKINLNSPFAVLEKLL